MTMIGIILISILVVEYHPCYSQFGESAAEEVFPSASNFDNEGNPKWDFDNEILLGSHRAAKEFDQLSPRESKKRLRILAEKMDIDKDGHINKEELIKWLLKSFQMLLEEEALEHLEEEDMNGDGKVTWREHVDRTLDGVHIQLEADVSRDNEDDKEIFQVADLDNDGFLDKHEFPAFSQPEEFEHTKEVIYKQIMRRRDKDKDGYLSFDEFSANSLGESPQPGSEQYLYQKNNFFDLYDKDHNGKLKKEEVLTWVVPDNNEGAETEAEHLIENCDENNDGKLSIFEIVNNYKTFIGSEATGFGEGLQKVSDEL